MTITSTIKQDFPTLVNDPTLVYLDSAASHQTPHVVIDAMNEYYGKFRSNVHRGLYTINETASIAYENARKTVADFIHAQPEEIIFTRGTTESLNLVALGWANQFINRGEEIIVTTMEHHSNIVPWQMLAKRKGIVLRYWNINNDGALDEKQFNELLNKRTRLVCITHVSNVLGTINPLKKIIQKAYAAKAKVVVDAAQSIAHLGGNMEHLGGPDFLAFSGHKMYGPTGIGVLYAKKSLLEQMEPVFGGGNMVREVTQQYATWNDIPWKFEAGTPPIAEAIGLGAAFKA
ncbi:MAG: Cysteine desulfurase, SufS subfamily [Candidatus Peregrinibacteria bacterium GW2011_GWA2_47_7]|nr:MAG: Cysteine desulfurase, SufS subfamily [Candidatus Peregrinibacteria bacterium GW2011_GWA2_47_7]